MNPDIEALGKLEVPVIVRLGQRQMTVGEVVALAPGAIVELPKNAEDELELLVNNKHVGYGVAVKVGENFGLRVTFIGDVRTHVPSAAASRAGHGERSEDEIAENLLAGQL